MADKPGGENWTDIIDGVTAPAYSGAETGSLTVANVPASNNDYQYRVRISQNDICFISSTSATLHVTSTVVAVDDDFTENPVTEGSGGIAGNVISNDFYNNQPVIYSDVSVSLNGIGNLIGVRIDQKGNIFVPASTTGGTYALVYQICDAANATVCSSANISMVVSALVKNENFTKSELSIYPNPVYTQVFVKVSDTFVYNNLDAKLFDLSGRLVREGKITITDFSIDVTGLESAIYILTVTSDSSEVTKRIAVTNNF